MHDITSPDWRSPLPAALLGSICLGCILGWVSLGWNSASPAFGSPDGMTHTVRLLPQLGIILSFAALTAIADRLRRSSSRPLAVVATVLAVIAVVVTWRVPNVVPSLLVGVAQGALMGAWVVRFRSDELTMSRMMLGASALYSLVFFFTAFFDAVAVRVLSVALPVVAGGLLIVPDASSLAAPTADACDAGPGRGMAGLRLLVPPAACLLLCKFAFGFVSYDASAFNYQGAYLIVFASLALLLALRQYGLPRRESFFIALVMAMCLCVCLAFLIPRGAAAAIASTVAWVFNLFLLAWFAQSTFAGEPVSLRACFAGWLLVYSLTAVANALSVALTDAARGVIALALVVVALVIALVGMMRVVAGKGAPRRAGAAGASPEAGDAAGTATAPRPDDAVTLEARTRELAAQHDLTESERNVLLLLAQGYSLKQTAAKLYVAENTAKFHRHNVYQKLGISSRDELIALTHDGGDATAAPGGGARG